MKIRQGFVSNSSSSSFVLYGVDEESAVGIAVMKAAKKKLKKKKDEEEYEYEERLADVLGEFIGKELEFVRDWEREAFWIGKNPMHMPDDMTMGQFKQSVVEQLSKICDVAPEEIAKSCDFWNEEVMY